MMAGGHGQKRVTPMPSKQSTQKEVPISKRMKSMPNQKIGASEEEPENLKKRPTMGMDKFLETHGVHLEREDDDFEPSAENERSIQEKQQNLRKTNTISSCQAMTLDTFLETNGIHVEGEEEHSGANANEVGDDDDDDFSDDEDYVGEYEDEVLHGDDNHLMETNNVKDTPKTRSTRGKIRCAKIHARSWEKREEVTFYEGQAVGPTPRRVKDLTYFIGTMGRNSDFIILMYTSWKAVPLKVKKRIWKYINSKFILPKEGKGWVMTGVREAWKGYKTRIKGKHFERYNNIEDMLKNRPLDIPEVQFQKLIAYWSIPSVKALSHLNSENRKKQQHRHRMGPISFARVRNEMREMNENKEDPSQVDVFVATRTGRKEKELDLGTQAVIDKLKSHQEAGDTPEKAFTAKEREIAKIKQQHTETISSMKTELHETKDRVQSLEDLVKLLLQQSSLGTNIDEALSLLRAKESTHDINSKQCSNGNDRPSSSTRDPK
ncbi:hypothetical protein AHAS_Ahas07G0086000 [Arachis hypogaea]